MSTVKHKLIVEVDKFNYYVNNTGKQYIPHDLGLLLSNSYAFKKDLQYDITPEYFEYEVTIKKVGRINLGN